MHRKAEIDRYLIQGLPGRAELRLRSHLGTCADCRGHYDSQVLLLRALNGSPAEPAPGEIERVARLAAARAGFSVGQPARGRLGAWLDRLLRVRAPVAVAVALVLVILAAGLIWLGSSGSTEAASVVGGKGIVVDGQRLHVAEKGPRPVLKTGQEVKVGRRGVAELELLRGGTLRVFPGSELVLHDDGNLLELEIGKVWCQVTSGKGGFQVVTKDALVEVVGTSFVVEKSTLAGTDVRVMEGSVEVSETGGAGRVRLEGKLKTRVVTGSAPEKPRLYRPARDRFDWRREWEAILHELKDAVQGLKDLFR